MKDLVIKVGEYQKGGETKGRYVRLGSIMDGDNGEYAIIDPTVNLAGCLIQQNKMNKDNDKQERDSLMCSVFSKDGGSKSESSQPASNNDFDDDIPGF